jgi:arylsulfatase A-like enzyme
MKSLLIIFTISLYFSTISIDKPNIVLVMTDDQGWGQVGYMNHPVLKTPNLDAMVANGLRFNRFYAAAPVCSPTRASVLTGRTNDRTGVNYHGYAIRLEEKFIAAALKKAGYNTGHFGKWHLNGIRGPGIPLPKNDTHHPGHFGFDEWLTVTNYFDINPYMSRKGEFVDFKGDSSEVIVDEALKYIKQNKESGKPFFVVIWYGSPHSPFKAHEADMKAFANLDKVGQEHHGELVAMDRSIGTLRKGLRDMNVADNTLIWFSSDNGGLKGVGIDTVGGLRGNKRTLYEGGIRVPGIIEWPTKIKARVTDYPASSLDIFPTIVDLLGLDKSVMLNVVDGDSLKPLFEKEIAKREKPIPFHYQGKSVIIDNDYKIMSMGKGNYELYNLKEDMKESKNLYGSQTEQAARLKALLDQLEKSVAKSVEGGDYPGGITKERPTRMFWFESELYKPMFEELKKRGYENWVNRANGKQKVKKSKNKKK